MRLMAEQKHLRTRLILVRHGETRWNLERRYQGQSNILLTASGRRQARQVAAFLKSVSIHAVYSSALDRAFETACILAKPHRAAPRKDARLNEIHFGKWEGRSARDLVQEKDPAFLKWASGKTVIPPEGESLAALQKRTQLFLKDILKKHTGQTIAVVSHSGTLRALMCRLFRLPLRSFWMLRVDPASISVFDFYGSFTQCMGLNQTAAHRFSL